MPLKTQPKELFQIYGLAKTQEVFLKAKTLIKLLSLKNWEDKLINFPAIDHQNFRTTNWSTCFEISF